jgi:hypothetical protein
MAKRCRKVRLVERLGGFVEFEVQMLEKTMGTSSVRGTAITR